jgi:hypothetical protein
MEPLNYALEDFDVELPPIAGGDETVEGGEGTEVSPAGEDTGGDGTGEQAPEGGAEGEEQQEQFDENGQRIDANGQPLDANGQPMGQAGGGYNGDGQPNGRQQSQYVPYSRFKEINERFTASERERAMLVQRLAQGGEAQQQQSRQQPPEMPEQYKELDKGMGGYMRHYLDPIAQYVTEMKNGYDREISEVRDESRFYRGEGRTLTPQQSQLVETTRDALTQKLREGGFRGSVERTDALLFLKGHAQYGKLFADPRQQQQQVLNQGVVAARRQAGKLGGRGAVTRERGETATVDLNAMPRSQRIAHFERVMGNTPV